METTPQPTPRLEAASLGAIAYEVLSTDQPASVLGATSLGIYIKPAAPWLIYLSFTRFRGPQTITLNEASPVLDWISVGQPVQLTSQALVFPQAGLQVSLVGSQVWQPAPPTSPPLEQPERYQNLVCLANEAGLKMNMDDLGSNLPRLPGSPSASLPPRFMDVFAGDDILQIQSRLRQKAALPLARLLENKLGAGPGLTPAADDFVLGLLLSLNRWPNLFWQAGSLPTLNRHMVQAACARTTLLSANLIECAARGWADERLIKALDLMVTGVASEPEIIPSLLGWGSSSGAAAFLGMAVALGIALSPP